MMVGMAKAAATNSTASWLAKRDALIADVFGYWPGVLPNRYVPDDILQWDVVRGLQGLVWNMSTHFETWYLGYDDKIILYGSIHLIPRSSSPWPV